MAAGTVFGAITILFAFLIIGAVIGMTLYFYYREKPPYSPLTGGDCDSGSIVLPPPNQSSPPDEVNCYVLGSYNVYPQSIVTSPTLGSADVVSAATDTYTPTGATMTGTTCMKLCDDDANCTTAICTTRGPSTGTDEANACTCTTYTTLPNSLGIDESSGCQDNGACSTVYVKNTKI